LIKHFSCQAKGLQLVAMVHLRVFLCSAMDWQGQPVPEGFVRYPPGSNVRLGSMGTLMLVSTRTQWFPDYRVYHSRRDIAVGGALHNEWAYQGTVAALFQCYTDLPDVSIIAWLGSSCISMYVFREYDGSSTIYSRSTDVSPYNRYFQYHVGGYWPHCWDPTVTEFVDYVDWPQ